MKKILSMAMAVVFLFSCTKRSVDDSENLVYQKPDAAVSASLFDNHIQRAVAIKENNSLVNALVASDEFRENGIPADQLDMKSIRKYEYDISAIAAIEIPVAGDTGRKLIAFYYRGKFAITFVTITAITPVNGIPAKRFTQSDARGNVFQTIDFTDGIKILGATNVRPLPFERFKNNSGRSVDKVPVSDEPTCYVSSGKVYSKCMTCAINECANSFPCNALCALEAGPCLIGFSLACVGVGA